MFKSSAPGSIMIMGEHAVLHGKKAIVAAIAKRIVVEVVPRTDRKVHIYSDIFGEYQDSLPIQQLVKPFHFVLAAIQHFQKSCPYGFDLTISSELDPQYGLGSSAAVTVATLHCLAKFTQRTLSIRQCHQQAHQIIQELQGRGSGADAAASCFGGVLAYCTQPYQYTALNHFPPLQLFYSGYKTPTTDVIEHVQQSNQRFADVYQQLYIAMDRCCQHSIAAWQQMQWLPLAKLMRIHQHLQAALGTSDDHLDHMINCLQSIDGILAAKISGSGLGDCVLSLGKPTDPQSAIELMHALPGVRAVDVEISESGVMDAH